MLLTYVFFFLQPQILQPFNPSLNEHPHLGRLVKTPLIVGHNDLRRSRSEQGTRIDAGRCVGHLMADGSGPTNPNELSRCLSSHLHRPACAAPRGLTAKDSPTSAAQSAVQHERRGPAAMLHSSVSPRPAGPTCPRMLQQALPKRVSLPALRSGGAGGVPSLTPGCSSGPLANRTKQLPPPSRGLPCFNAGPQVQASSLCHTSLLGPRRAAGGCTNFSLEESKQEKLQDPGSALIPLSRSSIPKPKVP